jgi:hypothetical protein
LENLVRSLLKEKEKESSSSDQVSDSEQPKEEGGSSCSLSNPANDPQHVSAEEKRDANINESDFSDALENPLRYVEPADDVVLDNGSSILADAAQEKDTLGDLKYKRCSDADESSIPSCEPTERTSETSEVPGAPKSSTKSPRRSILSPKSARKMASAAIRLFTMKTKPLLRLRRRVNLRGN